MLYLNSGSANFDILRICQDSDFGSEPLSILTAPLNNDASPDVAVLTITGDIAMMNSQGFIPTDIEDHYTEQNTPRTFSLGQNYPNPFNPTTTIRYQLPANSEVKLTIYNLLGQQVREVVNQQQGPGAYQVLWDGRSDSGVRVASGMYFYRLTAGGLLQTRKMLLVR